jgi:translation initiation factor 2B subunit (eIF-2B alpha/beta/delta family)
LDQIKNNQLWETRGIIENHLLPQTEREREALLKQRNLQVYCLKYDFTPMNCVSMIMCEIGRLNPVSVPVIVEEFNADRSSRLAE